MNNYTDNDVALKHRPKTPEEAYEHGFNSKNIHFNPFRNLPLNYYELNNNWIDGFESKK